MVPVLGRVASGLRQVARAEQQQDLDSPQTRRRSVRQRVWQSNTMLLGPVFGSALLRLSTAALSGHH
jgi:hypothetical protein